MLQETKVAIKDKCKQRMQGISLYRAAKDKIKIGGVGHATIDQFIKKDRKISTRTILKLIKEFDLKFDESFFDETGIIKIIPIEENKL